MNSSELLVHGPERNIQKRARTLKGWKGFVQEDNSVYCSAANGGMGIVFAAPGVVRVFRQLGSGTSECTSVSGETRSGETRSGATGNSNGGNSNGGSAGESVISGFAYGLEPGMATGVIQVSADWNPVIAVKDNAGFLEIDAGELSVRVNESDFTIQILSEGREIAADSRSASWNRQSFTLYQKLSPTESVYGLGEKTGYMDKKGKKYEMWNSDVFSAHTATTDPLYVSIPFFVRLGAAQQKPEEGEANPKPQEGPSASAPSIAKKPVTACGLYLDNSYRTSFDMGETDPGQVIISAPGGSLDCYYIAGNGLAEVLSRYAALTGKAPLPPRWALGHHQSRYSYKSSEEVLEVAKGFSDRKLDCASIHLDIHYMDGNRTFTWDEDAFPEPAALADSLAEQGIRLTAIIDPAIKADPEYPVYREMVQNDYSCRYADGRPYVGRVWPGECVFPDFVRADVRTWWGQKVLSFMDEHGIEGVWHDMNEPAVFNDESTMDLNVCHGENRMDSHGRYHNMYAYYECMATYEAIREEKKVRPFILTRAGFSGIQKYAAVWTGDNRSMWEHLELSLPMLLNMGLSGLPFVGADIGGFSFNTTPELLVRWYQLGMFYPFARNHCAEHARRQEPWSFGAETEKLLTEAMKQRERLLPDFYTSFYLASEKAVPVMRPLVWDYPDDEEVRPIYDQFLFADGLMGAPVLRPGVHVRQVYLPEGIWFDTRSGERLGGGRWILAEAPLESMPLYARAGSMVVTDEGEAGSLTVTLWHDASADSGEWLIYSDDGTGFGYESGEWALDRLSWLRSGDELTLKITTDGQKDFRTAKSYTFVIRNAKDLKNVTLDGKPQETKREGNEVKFTIEL